MTDYFDLHLPREELLSVSALGLAHLGDGVYELMVRAWLISNGFGKKQNLHRETVSRVRASYQSQALKRIEPMLTPLSSVRRSTESPPPIPATVLISSTFM